MAVYTTTKTLGCEVVAKYNMTLDNGSFVKDHVYQSFKELDDLWFYFVTTEEGNQQKLMVLDFYALFSLKN